MPPGNHPLAVRGGDERELRGAAAEDEGREGLSCLLDETPAPFSRHTNGSSSVL